MQPFSFFRVWVFFCSGFFFFSLFTTFTLKVDFFSLVKHQRTWQSDHGHPGCDGALGSLGMLSQNLRLWPRPVFAGITKSCKQSHMQIHPASTRPRSTTSKGPAALGLSPFQVPLPADHMFRHTDAAGSEGINCRGFFQLFHWRRVIQALLCIFG